MALRSEEHPHHQQPRKKEAAELATRQQHHSAKASSTAATPTAAAAATAGDPQDGRVQQPAIIECRKKNSKQESVITHRFRKGRLLGKGGFAHCYKVICVDTGRPYAMKIVPKSTLVKSRARQKLQTEIKIHRTLQHPRVVRFEMFFEDRENVYILLELCTNHSLSELIRKTKRFSEDEARRYMLQILEATSYLHQHQIIHRDLKLGNVFLDRDWNIKMGDFGLATKLQQDSERKRTICGTPNYIAPEILEGKAGHSYQVDLWSAGVILYTMLVGRPPYESTDVKSTYRRILANVYAFPDSIPVSDSAKNLVGRLLQVKPELRPSLDEILNHPFLRNGGPRQRFSTSHGLRGSSASSSPPSSAVPGGPSCGAAGSGSTATRLGTKKHNTPERDAAGGFGRPPLKTRSSNVEGEGDVRVESSARSTKARAGASAPTGKVADSDCVRDPLGVRNASKRPSASAVGPSSSRSAVPRTNGTKGFSVYCDAKEPTRGGGAGSRSKGIPGGSGGSWSGRAQSSTFGKRASPGAGSDRRRGEADAAVVVAGRGAAGGEPVELGDKENHHPRLPFGGSGGGGGGGGEGSGVQVAANAPVSRRPIVRSASTAACTAREVMRACGSRARGEGDGGSGATKVAVAGGRKASIRRVASTVGTQLERRRVSVRECPGDYVAQGRTVDLAAAGRVSGPSQAAAAAAATPKGRSFSCHRGTATSSPANTTKYSPYRSPLPGSGGRGSGTRVSTRAVAAGEGMTPRNQAPRKGGEQQRLDFGSTPRSTRQQRRDSPVAESSRGGGGGGGGGGGAGSKAAKQVRPAAAANGSACSRGATSSCPSSTTNNLPLSGAARGLDGEGIASMAVDLERDALESMHEVLAAGLAAGSTRHAAIGSAAGRSGVARATRASTAAARKAAARATEVAANTPAPSLWVTQYVDYSSKYGLGFLLCDGSAGVYFNDATKIVLEPAGVSFEYIERSRRSMVGKGGGGGGAGGEGGARGLNDGDHPLRARHTLDDFPPELQKKVTLLNHFRGYLHDLVKKSEESGNVTQGGEGREGRGDSGVEAESTKAQTLGSAEAADERRRKHQHQHQHRPVGELIFLRKWMRTRNAILFRLSNRTVQVVFSDNTEVLLSKEARVVTFVDKEGARETYSLQRVLEEKRPDITKRLLYSNELLGQMLRRT